MDKNVAIELTLRPVDADRADDIAGFAAYVPAEAAAAVGKLFQIAPNVAIRLTLPDPPPHERIERCGTGSADTAGFIMRDGGCFPRPSGVVIRIQTPVLERRPIVGPPPVEINLPDVAGFLNAARSSTEEGDGADTQGYLWWVYGLGMAAGAAAYAAGYGIDVDFYGPEDQTYYKSR